MRSFLALVLLATALSSCGHSGRVTPGEICLEIPFLDAQEGACVHTVNHKASLVSAKDWAERRKTMLMIDAKYWTEIKIDWLAACRFAGPECNVYVESVDSAIQALDKILKKAFPIGGK